MGYKSGRGGSRLGSGRPRSKATKVIRVPVDSPPIDDLLDVYYSMQAWKDEATNHPTSPRWEQLRRCVAGLPL